MKKIFSKAVSVLISACMTVGFVRPCTSSAEDLKMLEHDIKITVQVKQTEDIPESAEPEISEAEVPAAPAPTQESDSETGRDDRKPRFGRKKYICYDGRESKISVYECTDPDIAVTSSDPSAVEVVKVQVPYGNSHTEMSRDIYITGHKAGKTAVLTVTDGKGRTDTCEVYVEYTDVSYPEGELYIRASGNRLECRAGHCVDGYVMRYETDRDYMSGETPLNFSIEDENIAELRNIQGCFFIIKGLSAGKTVLTVKAPDGRSTQTDIIVHEDSSPPVITSVPDDTDNSETTSTTVSTKTECAGDTTTKPAATTVKTTATTTVNNTDTPGDLNNDNRVNVADLVFLQKMLNSNSAYSRLADMNRDGTVNVFDMVLLKRIILGIG